MWWRRNIFYLSVVVFLAAFIVSGILLFLGMSAAADKAAIVAFIVLALGFLWGSACKLLVGIGRSIIAGVNFLVCLGQKIITLPLRGVILVIACFYFLFLFVNFDWDKGLHFKLPGVYGGDEQHYLLMVNSLINDYDLKLRNNYQQARDGGNDAGRAWQARLLDHHTIFVHKETKEKLYFDQVVHVAPQVDRWEPQVDYESSIAAYDHPEDYWERPHHPPGMSFLFALFLFPFAGFPHLESIVLVFLVVFALLGYICLHKILSTLGNDKKIINLTVYLIALATPVYFYSLHLFKEMFLGSLLVMLCWLFFFKRDGFFSGLLVILGCFTRYSFPVVILPLLLIALARKQWRQVVVFLCTVGLGAMGLLFYNYYMHGGILSFSQYWIFGQWLSIKYLVSIFVFVPILILILMNLVKFIKRSSLIKEHYEVARTSIWILGLLLLIFSGYFFPSLKEMCLDLRVGLLPFSPILIFPLLALLDIKMWQEKRVVGVLGVIVIYIIVYVVKGFQVGSAYSSRQMVTIVPLLGVPLYYVIKTYRSKLLLALLVTAAIYSLIINMCAAGAPRFFWHLPLPQASLQLGKLFWCHLQNVDVTYMNPF